ncbi:MAG TPA: MFS transporter [bacterium]|jgi:MFS family permease|nr:MFS transporter [bacterium]
MAHEAAASPVPLPPSGFLALMRNRNYALLWWSQGVSQLGDRFHWVAISLWVYAVTKSALAVSYAIIALMVGPAVVGLFAGALVDRWNRKRTMVVADLIRGALVALIPWLMARSLLFVYVDLFLVSCASSFFRPAMLASIPRIVAKTELMPANSFLATVDTGTEVIGPLAAGYFVQLRGYSQAMYFDAASYFVSAFLVGLLSLPDMSTRAAAVVKEGTSILGDIKEGLRYIRKDRLQFGLLMFVFLGWWVSGLNSVQTPLAKTEFGLSDAEFGWFNTVWGVGYVAASLVLGWYGRRIPSGRLIAAGFLGWAMATGITGLSLNSGMLYAAVFWVGFANIALFIGLSTTIMEVTPSEMLGRVIAIRQVSLTAVRLAAMVAFGYVADRIGIRESVLAMAGASLVGLLIGFRRFPEVAGYGGRPMAPSSAERTSMPPSMGRLVHVLFVATDPAYPNVPQRSLNITILFIVWAVWIALLIRDPVPALYIAGTVVAGILLKIMMSWWRARGSMNVRQRGSSSRRESEEVSRSPVTTGPTAR